MEKFFSRVWKFNALIIAASGILVIIVALFTLSEIRGLLFPAFVPDMVNVEQGSHIEEKLSYGRMTDPAPATGICQDPCDHRPAY
jgi:hypothetical protein